MNVVGITDKGVYQIDDSKASNNILLHTLCQHNRRRGKLKPRERIDKHPRRNII